MPSIPNHKPVMGCCGVHFDMLPLLGQESGTKPPPTISFMAETISTQLDGCNLSEGRAIPSEGNSVRL